MRGISRRQLALLGIGAPLLSLFSGCRAGLPRWTTSDTGPDALALLHHSAMAHGLAAFSAVEDLSVSYSGHWRRLVARLQPELVDAGFRGGSEERLLIRAGIIAQAHHGPRGAKQVVSIHRAEQTRSLQVWFNGVPSHDRRQLDAAALVAEAYALFLLGPMLLVANQAPHRDMQASMAPETDVKQGGRTYPCDVVSLRLAPGLGNAASDQLAVHIDRTSRLMRRVRMTLNGLESTQGALVDIDTYDHRVVQGIVWPTTFHERLLRPAPLDVHAWRLTGLDINRGLSPAEVSGEVFRDQALPPATPLLA